MATTDRQTQALLDALPQAAARMRSLVIMGMPKSGTTLPLTLLDDHPRLITLPEELRFFHCHADAADGIEAKATLFANPNMQFYKMGARDFDDYRETGGTGVGRRDYSNLDFDRFEALVEAAFRQTQDAAQRYTALFLAFELSRGNSIEETLQGEAARILVSKAPDNELFLYRWNRMLGDRGQYLLTVRHPYELYLSLNNIQHIHARPDYDLDEFIDLYRSRLKLVGLTPLADGQLYILRYEDLIASPEQVMREVAAFLAIDFTPSLLTPTKNGIPWAGNSSRGIRQEAIYANPQTARQQLPPDQRQRIAGGLAAEMEILGYQP